MWEVAWGRAQRRPSSSMESRKLFSSDVALGAFVRVLPGRNFPAFKADDEGIVVRMDLEARTCDVLFSDRPEGAEVTVALRHLTVVADGGSGSAATFAPVHRHDVAGHGQGRSSSAPKMGDDGSDHHHHHQSWPTSASPSAAPHRSRSPRAASPQARSPRPPAHTLREGRALSPPSSPRGSPRSSARTTQAPPNGSSLVASMDFSQFHEGSHGPGSRVVEGTELKRSLDEAMSQQGRARRISAQEQTEEEELERRAGRMQDRLERIRSAMEGQERRAASLEDVVDAASAGLARLGELLESQEHRTAELGQSISQANESVSRLGATAEAQAHRLTELERRCEGLGGRGHGAVELDRGRQDNEPVWQALRELQELVVHESEHRAAGLREVLGVLGQGVEQLRGEQARYASDVESRQRSEARKAKQQLDEMQASQKDHDKRAETIAQRLDALNQAVNTERGARAEAIAWVEEQVREARGALLDRATIAGGADGRRSGLQDAQPVRPSSAGSTSAAVCFPGKDVSATSQVTAMMVTTQSMSRLDALEARLERGNTADAEVTSQASQGERPQLQLTAANTSATEDTLCRLRGQLEGLRSELAASSAAEAAMHSESTPTLQNESVAGARTLRSPRGSAASPRGLPRSGSPSSSAAGAFAQSFGGQAPLSPVRTIRSPSPMERATLAETVAEPLAGGTSTSSGARGASPTGDPLGRGFGTSTSSTAPVGAVSSSAAGSPRAMPMMGDVPLARVEGAAGEAQSRLAEAFRAVAGACVPGAPLGTPTSAGQAGAGARAGAMLTSPRRQAELPQEPLAVQQQQLQLQVEPFVAGQQQHQQQDSPHRGGYGLARTAATQPMSGGRSMPPSPMSAQRASPVVTAGPAGLPRHQPPPLPLAALSASAAVVRAAGVAGAVADTFAGSHPSSRNATPRAGAGAGSVGSAGSLGSLLLRTGPAKVAVDEKFNMSQAHFGTDESPQQLHREHLGHVSFQESSFSTGLGVAGW